MNIKDYINSGILELYVLGGTTVSENIEIEQLAAIYPEIKNEIDLITESLVAESSKAISNFNPTIKPMVMATVDYAERMKSGEIPTYPMELNEQSKISDYDEWLNRPDMILPEKSDNIFVKIIGYKPTITTAILWIKDATPYEKHTTEYEKFLIVEGGCDVITDEKTYALIPGNYLSIPLHEGHEIKVTSKNPCKAILQRVTA
jgi:quercetin dioxygenase-like cupin family protein